jgi:hypothetical protein
MGRPREGVGPTRSSRHAEIVTYRGVRAVKLVPATETAGKDEEMLAILDQPVFKDGTIDGCLFWAGHRHRGVTNSEPLTTEFTERCTDAARWIISEQSFKIFAAEAQRTRRNAEDNILRTAKWSQILRA